MSESKPTESPPEKPTPPDTADLGWVRWGITFAGLGLVAGGYGMATDDHAGSYTRLQGIVFVLFGLGFAVSMWVPPVARAFGWVLRKLQ